MWYERIANSLQKLEQFFKGSITQQVLYIWVNTFPVLWGFQMLSFSWLQGVYHLSILLLVFFNLNWLKDFSEEKKTQTNNNN